MGLTHYFHGKKGGGWNFLRSEGRGPKTKKKMQKIPLQVFVNSPVASSMIDIIVYRYHHTICILQPVSYSIFYYKYTKIFAWIQQKLQATCCFNTRVEKKAHTSRPRGLGAQTQDLPRAGRGSPATRQGSCLDKQAFPCL